MQNKICFTAKCAKPAKYKSLSLRSSRALRLKNKPPCGGCVFPHRISEEGFLCVLRSLAQSVAERITLRAPPRRLELRSSAPEADTLSTELRGRAERFYHNGCGGADLRPAPPVITPSPAARAAQARHGIARLALCYQLRCPLCRAVPFYGRVHPTPGKTVSWTRNFPR